MADSRTVSVGTGPCFILFVVFLVLKLTKVIGWSWWWVTSPLWIPTAIAVAIFGVLFLCSVIVAATKR